MALNNLVVKPASELQTREVVVRNAAHWGVRAGVSEEEFMKFDAVFRTGEFAREGRVVVWVLVPADSLESTDFYASCQVYTREVLVLYPGQTTATSEFGHGISSVLTPPQHRGKGYARRLMSLLHVALAPLRYPHLQKSVILPEGHPPSTVSVLYSSVGDFYASCPPCPDESGWIAPGPTKVLWKVESLDGFTADSPLATDPILESGIAPKLSSDDKLIPGDLLELQKSDPTKTYFAFAPTAPLNAWSLTLSKFISGCPPNVTWGAQVPGTNDFMIWVYHPKGKSLKLFINRLRASAQSFPALFEAAILAARENKCEIIEVWNLPQHLVRVAQATGGELTERRDSLSAFKWYGKGQGSDGSVVWALDER